MAIGRAADKPAHDDNRSLGSGRDYFSQKPRCLLQNGLGLREPIIGNDDTPRIYVLRRQSCCLECKRYNQTGETLAQARDGVHGAGGKLADDGKAFDQFLKPVEVRADIAVKIRCSRPCNGKSMRQMVSTQFVYNCESPIPASAGSFSGRFAEACSWSYPLRRRRRWADGLPRSEQCA